LFGSARLGFAIGTRSLSVSLGSALPSAPTAFRLRSGFARLGFAIGTGSSQTTGTHWLCVMAGLCAVAAALPVAIAGRGGISAPLLAALCAAVSALLLCAAISGPLLCAVVALSAAAAALAILDIAHRYGPHYLEHTTPHNCPGAGSGLPLYKVPMPYVPLDGAQAGETAPVGPGFFLYLRPDHVKVSSTGRRAACCCNIPLPPLVGWRPPGRVPNLPGCGHAVKAMSLAAARLGAAGGPRSCDPAVDGLGVLQAHPGPGQLVGPGGSAAETVRHNRTSCSANPANDNLTARELEALSRKTEPRDKGEFGSVLLRCSTVFFGGGGRIGLGIVENLEFSAARRPARPANTGRTRTKGLRLQPCQA
ncbi:MAG: hypothetical protein BJ554DRAFT_3875, partial [Olpidium bornovanus]